MTAALLTVLLLSLIGPLVRRLRRPAQPAEEPRPRVSLVISLHNEEKLIAQRIDNFEALDYLAENLELLLGDDCSSDRTTENPCSTSSVGTQDRKP